MNVISCLKCKRMVIAAEVAQLNDLVMFDVDPVLVLVDGHELRQACQPHVCQGLPVSVDRSKYIPIEEVRITCKYCGEDEFATKAVFTSEDGWKCNLCEKDHAEQAAKSAKLGRATPP